MADIHSINPTRTPAASAPWAPVDAQKALVFVQSMVAKWPLLLRHCRHVNTCHTALLMALQQAAYTSRWGDEGDGGMESKENNLLHGGAAEGYIIRHLAVQAADPLTQDDVQRLQHEVVRLHAQYEPVIGGATLQAVVPPAVTGKKHRTKPLEVEEGPELLDKLLEAARQRYTEAKTAEGRLVAHVEELLGSEESAKKIFQVKAQHCQREGRYIPGAKLDSDILAAVVEVEEAKKDIEVMEGAVQEAKVPWRVAARLQQRCDELRGFVVAIGKAMVSLSTEASPTTQLSKSGGGGESKGDEASDPLGDLQQHQEEQDMTKLTSLLGPYHAMRDAAAEQKNTTCQIVGRSSHQANGAGRSQEALYRGATERGRGLRR